MSAIPKIDDQFWFDLSGDIVKNSVSRFNDAATKLYNFITWMYTVFAASTIVSFKINDTVNWLVYVTPIPFLLITVAAISAVNAQMPVPISFDPRIPVMIEEAYKKTVSSKIKSLKKASVLVITGSLLTSLIIFYSFVLTKSVPKCQVQFDTSYFITQDSTAQITISGNLQTKLMVKVSVYAEDSLTKNETVAVHQLIETSDSGDFATNFNTPVKSKRYKVTLEWSENSMIKTLTMLSSKK